VPDKDVFKDEIALWLGIDKDKIALENAFLRFKKASGFSSICGLPKIKVNALRARSVIVLKNNSNRKIEVPSSHAFGIRTEEGYGQVVFEEYAEKERLAIKPVEEKTKTLPKVEQSESKEFIKFILLKRLKNRLKEEALERIKGLFKVPNTFLGKMMLFLRGSENFKEVNEKLKGLKDRALGHLEKMAGHLFIKDKQVDEREFKQFVEQKMEAVYILKKADLQEDFFEDKLYELYRIYSLSILNALRLAERKAL